MKNVKAVAPYIHPGSINFKTAPYEAWIKTGGDTAASYYPPRLFHRFAYKSSLPTWFKGCKEARLRFVEPVSINFDTFPDYALHEVIPFIWDCWPRYYDKLEAWFKRNNVRTAIFTSIQEAEEMSRRCPQMNITAIIEGVDTSLYDEGKPLNERKIDLLEFGRSNERIFKATLPDSVNHVCTKVGNKYIYTKEQLFKALSDAKITIALPRCDTQPEIAGDVETLTQRYWECMLSRIIMVGRAPRELIDFIGYNPVITLDKNRSAEQITDILTHIDDYKILVDKNRACAMALADWTLRMETVRTWLQANGYNV